MSPRERIVLRNSRMIHRSRHVIRRFNNRESSSVLLSWTNSEIVRRFLRILLIEFRYIEIRGDTTGLVIKAFVNGGGRKLTIMTRRPALVSIGMVGVSHGAFVIAVLYCSLLLHHVVDGVWIDIALVLRGVVHCTDCLEIYCGLETQICKFIRLVTLPICILTWIDRIWVVSLLILSAQSWSIHLLSNSFPCHRYSCLIRTCI